MPDTLPPLADPSAEGARKINTAIEKNRGLTPHRNKAGKNPRKKNRTKFEKAKVRPAAVLSVCTCAASIQHQRLRAALRYAGCTELLFSAVPQYWA